MTTKKLKRVGKTVEVKSFLSSMFVIYGLCFCVLGCGVLGSLLTRLEVCALSKSYFFFASFYLPIFLFSKLFSLFAVLMVFYRSFVRFSRWELFINHLQSILYCRWIYHYCINEMYKSKPKKNFVSFTSYWSILIIFFRFEFWIYWAFYTDMMDDFLI